MELRVLRYFLTVAQEESISAAAEVLHVTQPTLSRQLMELEAELGTKLFARGRKKRRMALTEAGSRLRWQAEEILALASNPVGAKQGDVVEVTPADGRNISTSVIVFLLPCVGLGAGYVLGQSLLGLGDMAAMATAAAGLVVGFLPAILLNRAMTRSQKPEFQILKRLTRS